MSTYRVPAPRSQPTADRPAVLVVSDRALQRHRLHRALRRAGAAPVAVDPWACEAELGRGPWDVVLWWAPRHERLARSLLVSGGGPAAVLVMEDRAGTGRLVDALSAGFEDAAAGDRGREEVVARAMAAAVRARRRRADADAAAAFRGLADGSRDLLMRLDPAGRVLFASAAARPILATEPALMVGRRLLEICHPDERDALAAALEGDAPARGTVAHRLPAAGGRWAWVETTVGVVRDAGGRVRELHTDSRDVGERMREDAERGALMRVTAAVAGGAELGTIAGLAAREAAALTGAETAGVARFHGDEGIVVGAAGPGLRAGERVPLAVVSPRSVTVQVIVDGAPWGLILARTRQPASPPPGMVSLAELVALAVDNARSHERLLALATTDPLTGLANRRTFHERLDAECARAARAGAPLSLVIIDLDHFKRINDTHGHQVGDDVLREVSRRLRARCRREDTVARLGGEELAWLLPAAGVEDAAEAAERLRRDIGAAPVGDAVRVTASLGVAELGWGEGPRELVRRADAALYAAKEGGRDACVVDRPPGALTGAPSA